MTNAEKYLKVSVNEFFKAIINSQIDISGFYSLEKWLLKETKPTLTEDERVILRNIKYTALDKIKRTNKGALYIEHFWIDYGEQIRFLYDNLFQFIKERRRI